MTDWEAIVGAAHVHPGTADDAIAGTVPRQVVHPGSIADIQAIVRAAGTAGERLSACGLGAHRDLGTPPERIDVLLRLDRLARIVDHQAADMTATVEAGCSLAALDATLGTAGQWLPLDPPHPDRTSVGGLVAANLSGPLRASQGTARDLVIGMKIVGYDGALVSGGGRVVKNVAGYDLPKLHIGAMGTLGIVVEVSWKVRPRPAVEAAVVVASGSAGEAADLALRIRDLVEPCWLTAVGRGVLPAPLTAPAAVVVGLAGITEEITAHHDVIAAEMARTGYAFRVPDDVTGLRRAVADFPTQPARAVLRCATLPTQVASVMQATAGHRALAHVANGVVLVAIDDDAAVARTLDQLRALVTPAGGSVVLDRAPAALKCTLDVYGPLGDGAALMQAVRRQFDPSSVFADR